MNGDYEVLTRGLADSIRLGYEVEAEDPTNTYELPPDDEVRGLDPVA